MRVLGVDPGLRTTGYGVVDTDGTTFRLIEGGVLRPKTTLSLDRRLAQLHDAILDVVQTTKPDFMVVEELWSAPKHPPTAVLMGHARGVIALAAGQCDVGFEELSHTTVKRALTGHGGASKAQVKAMIVVRLGLSVAPEPDDVSDALALAIVFALRHGSGIVAALGGGAVLRRGRSESSVVDASELDFGTAPGILPDLASRGPQPRRLRRPREVPPHPQERHV
jgi:crossover junction endodeoxyribonuclease RuvC